jgi:hypothetical protein
MEKCPNCGVFFTHCPCCGEDFCDMCNMTAREAEDEEEEE